MFDAYGTLFDVAAAVMRAGASLGPNREAFAALWRAKQLEYTWTYSAMGLAGNAAHDFSALTARALDFCFAQYGITDGALHAALLDAYQTLDAYPDVAPTLAELKAAGHVTAIFTNGTRRMVDAAIAAAGLGAQLDHVVTVEGTGRFKPDMAVYQHALHTLGSPAPAAVVFVSSNRWDVAGAAAFGFTPVWVNRTGRPPEYPGLDPIVVVPDLSGLGGL